MPASLDVFLGDRFVGTLTNLPGDYNIFSFDDDFAGDPQRPVLSQSLLDASGEVIRSIPRTKRIAPAFFANELPNVDGLLRGAIARQNRIDRSRDFPFLQVLGRDLPGAVILRTAEPVTRHDGSGEPLEERARIGFSLAGAQLKFSADMGERRVTIPISGYGGSWIVKIPSPAYPQLTENEFAMMSFARGVGFDVPQIRRFPLGQVDGIPEDLQPSDLDTGEPVYAIARFDRTPAGRVHCEDLNQVFGQQPRDLDRHRTLSDVAFVVQTLCEPKDLDELIGRIVFGICIGNGDMHLKNWALLYRNGRDASLAPMYDFVCTARYFRSPELILSFGGTKEFERVDERAVRAFAERAEISLSRAVVVARQTVERMRDLWPSIRETIADPKLVHAVERIMGRVPLYSGRGA